MDSIQKINRAVLLLGDITLLYTSLILTLYIRYRENFYTEFLERHLEPFTLIFIIWIIVFYIIGLYDLSSARNTLNFNRMLIGGSIISGIIALLIFYLIPTFGITPKTNLFIFIGIFIALEYNWRRAFNKKTASMKALYRLLLVGEGETVEAIKAHIKENPQLGYEIVTVLTGLSDPEFNHLAQIILTKNINLIAVPVHIKKDTAAARKIYQNLALGIEVLDLADLYETLFKKVPLAELEEVWFLENLLLKHRAYEAIKRPSEVLFASFLFIILIPLNILIAFLIKITSPGEVIYKQVRIGKRGSKFILYKWRTMKQDAEANGPQWSSNEDTRVTQLGKLLRHTHLDELPQLINIIKGNISFVGPRPERPGFIENLESIIPYYDIRHLIKPGLTGWAQINYRYGSSVNDAYQKLQYDIYYLKNRSIFLDLAIIIRTIKLFFTNVE